MEDCVLVTGGAGFIGNCLVRQLVREDQVTVVNLDKLTYAGNLESLEDLAGNPRHHFVEGDIRDRPLLERLLEQYQPRAIFHLAAESHVDRSIDGPDAFVQTNLIGTFELLEAVRAALQRLPEEDADRFRFVHVSTDEVFGSLGPEGRFNEHSPYAPNSPYSASKAGADHLARAYYHTYGLPVLITNCSNNFGPRQFPEKLIPLMILNALAGHPLPVYGDGGNVRDWLYVDDHTHALRLVLAKGRAGETYTIGGDSERTNLAVVQKICETVDRLAGPLPSGPRAEQITFVADRPGHDRRYAIDSSKAQRELDWQPSHAFEDGLEATVRWYLDNPQWTARVQSGEYRRRRGLGG